MNNLTILGNLVRPVELKFLNNGSAAARLTVAAADPLLRNSAQLVGLGFLGLLNYSLFPLLGS